MKRRALMLPSILLLSSVFAFAGQFVIYPGSKIVPPMSTETEDMYVTQDSYDKVVAYYSKIGKVERSMEQGGRRTMFSFDAGVKSVVWEAKDHVVSISAPKKK